MNFKVTRRYRLHRARTWTKAVSDAGGFSYGMRWMEDGEYLELRTHFSPLVDRWTIAYALRENRKTMRREIAKRRKIRQWGRQVIGRCIG